MKRRKIMSLLLAAAMALSLAGCAGQASRDPDPALDAPQPMEEYEKARKTDLDQLRHEGAGSGQASPEAGKQQGGDPGKLPVGPAGQPAVPGGTDVNPIAFEDYLQASLQAGEWAGKSYMASPASFRAALCLLIEGAGGDTLDGLLKAAWFGSVDDARAWYARLLEHQASFREQAEAIDGMAARYMEDFGEGDLGVSVDVEGGGSGSGMAFDIANGIWDNLDKPGSFTKAYADSVSGRYGAAAKSSKAGDITKDVNGWCDEATNGMIPSISDDLSGSSSVLANEIGRAHV